jgi:hypothetical protein
MPAAGFANRSNLVILSNARKKKINEKLAENLWEKKC